MPRSVQEIRQANGGLENLTDFEIAQHEFARYKPYYESFDQFAQDTGLETGGKWGNRFSASIDNYQAGMLGLGEAITGSETLGRMRRSNEMEALNARQLAGSQGAISSYKDVSSFGGALDYVGGLAVDSAPYLVEAATGGIAGRALLTGGKLALSKGAASTIGGVAASYPSAVGDILQNQRDQAGETRLGMAALGGVPYAAANAVGITGAAARGELFRSGVKALDDLGGVGGALARTGATVVRTAPVEGLSETGQEVINQSFGRMAVDPSVGLLDDDAIERYKESFVGGAALGGTVGGAMGGWRRSEGYLPPGQTVDGGTVDLLNNWTTTQGFEGMAPRSAPEANPLGDLTPDWTTSQGFEDLQRPPALDATDLYPAVDDAPLVPAGERVPVNPSRNLDIPGLSLAPDQMPVDFMGTVAATDQQVDQMQDPGAVMARQIWMERQQAEQAVMQQAAAKRQEIEQMRQRAEEVGLKGDKAAEVLQALDAARAEGVITDGQFAENLGMLQARQYGPVRRFIDGITATKKAQADSAVQEREALFAKVRDGATDTAPGVPAPTGAQTVAAQTPGDSTSPVAPGQQPDTTGEDAPAVGPAKEALRAKYDTMPANVKQRLLWALGVEMDPETGAWLMVDSPRTFSQVAELEGQRTGKKLTRQAIAKSLDKYGITEDTLTQAVATTQDTVGAEELGTVTEGEASGFRQEDTLSKAAGQGLLDGETTSAPQRTAVKEADTLLKAAPVEQETADTFAEKRKMAARQQLERDLQGALAKPEAQNAITDWNDSRFDAAPEFDSLTTAEKLELLDEYFRQTRETGNEWGPLETLIQNLSREAMGTRDRASFAGAGSRTAADGGVGAQPGGGRVEPAGAENPGRSERGGTSVEVSEAAWTAWSDRFPMMPKWASLTERQRKQVIDLVQRDQFNLAAAQTIAGGTTAVNKDVTGPEVPLNRDVLESKGTGDAAGATVEQVVQDLKAFMRVDTLGRRVKVVQSISDLPEGFTATSKTQGLAVNPNSTNRVVYLIADNINPSNVRAVFLHEVGAHLGIDNMLSKAQFDALVNQIKGWARDGKKKATTREQKLAVAAANRVMAAEVSRADLDSELLAYFVEEAVLDGVDPIAPSVRGPLSTFMATLVRFMRAALIKIGFKPETLVADDIVDLAYGAARMELTGRSPADKREGGPASVKASIAATRSGVPQVDAIPDSVGNLLQWFKDKGGDLGRTTMFTKDLVALAQGKLTSAPKYMAAMDKIQVERGRMERQVDAVLEAFRRLPSHLQGVGEGGVNRLIKDMTMSRKWAYKPEWLQNVEVDKALAERYNALPDDAKTVVRQVFEHGNKTREEMRRAAMANIDNEFDADITEAKADGNTAKVTKLEGRRTKARKEFSDLFDMGGGWPYAPLKRFGKYVVMGVSQAYKDAKTAGDRAKMRELEGDEKHYYVSFAETQASARKLARDIAGNYAETGHFEKLDQADAWMSGRDIMGAFNRLRTLVKDTAEADVDRSTNARLDQMLRQMYLTLLAENSARKSEITRRNVAGADNDMMRAFATQGRATAHFIAGLKSNGEVTDTLRDMANESRASLSDRDGPQAYFNEIMRRHSMMLEYQPAGLIDKAMAGTSIWMLLTNPSYHLINALQPWMATVPLLSAKHGYGRASGAFVRAYRDIMPALKDFSIQEDDYSKLPADVQKMAEELANRGVIDISLESQLGRFESEGDGMVRDAMTKVTTKLRNGTQFIEAMNRLSTAVAAYRLEKERGATDAAATDYAAKAIYETHGDYSGFNAPRFMRQGFGRLATQFRKFQLIQISMFARYMQRAMKGVTPEERAVGRLALTYSLGHLFAAGGLMGLPGFAAISWIMGKVFGDDDEPQDAEAQLRRAIGDKELADLLLKGVPKLSGVDISGRVGAGGMLSILPYTDVKLSRDGYAEVAIGLAGPFFGGLLPRAVDGVDLIGKGDHWKGLEQLLPSGLSNAMKAARFATEGVTRRSGDVDMTPDEISFLTAAAQAVGLPSNALTDRQFLSNAKFKADEFYRERTTSLKRQYTKAVNDGDEAARREAIDTWNEVQAARRRLGLPAQPLSTLLRAPREQDRREAGVTGGIQVRPTERRFVEQLTQ